LQPPKPWYYAIGGEQTGPISRSELSALIQSGRITRETLVWSEGTDDWIPARQTEQFRSDFQPTSAVPPPLVGQSVPNGVVWTLALVPLLDVFTLGAFPWWAFFIVNTVLCILDKQRLRRAGHSSPFTAWIFFVPVYLFVRASKTRERPDYGYVWILCFVVSILMAAPIFPVR
jgi:hypothetical protein